MIEWLPSQFTGGIKAVDVKDLSVKTAGDTFKGAVVNFIPAQMAGELAQQAGLADQSGWCPVEPTSFESKLQPGIHIVGDATSGGDMPKSAFLRQQPGQGLRLRHRRGTHRFGAFCPSFVQHLLHVSRRRRCGE